MRDTLIWSGLVRAPMLRFSVPMILGMWLAEVSGPSLRSLTILFCVVTLVAGVLIRTKGKFEHRWLRGIAFAVWTFVFGTFYYVLRSPGSAPDHIAHVANTSGIWTLKVTSVSGVSPALVRADGKLTSHSIDGTSERVSGAVMVSLLRGEDSAMVRVGDNIVLTAEIEPIERIPDPGGFDRKAWAASQGIEYELFAPRMNWVVTGHTTHWTDAFSTLRQRVSLWINGSTMPMRERALVKALVLGLRDELTPEQRTSFVRSGTIHVLAVSGTHVGFIYAMLFVLFRWSGESKKVRFIRGTFILLALWGYAGLTGGSPSVLRATIMFSSFTFADMFSQRNNTLNSLFTAAFLLLIFEPHMLVEIGFQLSFLAVLGIVLFMQPLSELWAPENWLVGKVWSLIVISLAAQTLTTPLSIYLFSGFPVWFIPANLIVVTAAGLAVYGSVGLLLFYKVPLLGAAITWCLTMLLKGVGYTTEFFAALPGAYPTVRISYIEMLLLYAVIALFALAIIQRWRAGGLAGAVVLSIFMISIGIRTRTLANRDQFTIYDDSRAVQAAFSTGRDLMAMTDLSAEDNATRFNGKVDRHVRSMGANEPVVHDLKIINEKPILAGKLSIGNGQWCSSKLNIAFLGDGDHLKITDSTAKCDAVVLHDLKFVDEKDLVRIEQCSGKLVLAGTIPWKLRSFVTKWCKENDLTLHDVREDGAFILVRE